MINTTCDTGFNWKPALQSIWPTMGFHHKKVNIVYPTRWKEISRKKTSWSPLEHTHNTCEMYNKQSLSTTDMAMTLNQNKNCLQFIFVIIYTTAIWGQEILHLKVRKFGTKVVSQQNSVNHHSRAKLHIVCNSLHCV